MAVRILACWLQRLSSVRLSANAFLLMAICLAGCVTPSKDRDVLIACTAVKVGENWFRVEEPVDAEILRGLAQAGATYSNAASFKHEYWFGSEHGEVLLCRIDGGPSEFCAGESWRFSQEGNEWSIAKNEAWICVT